MAPVTDTYAHTGNVQRASRLSPAPPCGEGARVAEQAIAIVGVVVPADAPHAVDEHQPLAVHDVEYRLARIGIFGRHLRHRDVETAHHRSLDFLLLAGQRAPQAATGPEGLAILLQLLRRIALGVHADGDQPDVAPLLQRDQAVLQLLHLRLQARAGIRTGGEDEVGDPDAARPL